MLFARFPAVLFGRSLCSLAFSIAPPWNSDWRVLVRMVKRQRGRWRHSEETLTNSSIDSGRPLADAGVVVTLIRTIYRPLGGARTHTHTHTFS